MVPSKLRFLLLPFLVWKPGLGGWKESWVGMVGRAHGWALDMAAGL